MGTSVPVADPPPPPSSQQDSGPDSSADAGIDSSDDAADADAGRWTGGGGVCTRGTDCPSNEYQWCINGYCAAYLCLTASDTACTGVGGSCRPETPDGGSSVLVCEFYH